jgi:ribose transport system ATP-binding protein
MTPAAQTQNSSVLLRAEGVSKRFGITQALDNVSVQFLAGEVHALMGENGAGKSTLGKVISGLHKQDAGTITIAKVGGGEAVLQPGSIDDAFAHGVRIVHQELAQCPNLSVAENLCLHDLPRTKWGTVDVKACTERAARLLSKLEPAIDVKAPLSRLSPGHRQIVQIAGSLDDGGGHGSGARLIVFDEPTSSLSIAEVDRLLEIIRQLAKSGITCVYVSHRMGEIFAVCDRVSVLRDGKFVATSVVRDIDEGVLVEQMIGRKVPPPVRRAKPPAGVGAALEVRGLSSPGKLDGVSLSVSPGEILGVGGLVGAGRSELLDAVFGLDPAATGEVKACGKTLLSGSSSTGPRGAIRAGVGYVPEDRKLQGLFFQLGVAENIAVPAMPTLAGAAGLRNLSAERDYTGTRLKSFQVKTASPASVPGSLSGGNQQKLLIARWMGPQTKVLLLDEPTRGIDVGTKAQIYQLVREAAQSGTAVLLVSSEMPELLALSDRLVVLCEGRVTGELTDDRMTQENILRLATVDSQVAAR